MGQYLPIVVLTALAVIFGVLSLVASKLLAPKRPNTAKDAPYECGIVPSRESPERFPVSFYIVAMLFIMFDIEIIFAYPYAVARESLGAFGFWEMIAFSAVFFVAFVYMVARGALEWGPVSKERPVSDVSALPTARAGVKIVGLDGRSLPDGREAGAA
ncbi:MAG: NADH-ubiquinone/plastoquinone oxidoreductase chain 3 [Actinobacteria bacterium]|jgi:NADH-quinone oxidoreductase subunit A|nr:NADH-ubiquinone/plastoquinone oxidoreductase chain 3 [Actinomycetota bacterium]NCZ67364.1 NADH-ubiquinone/plastoquinone oxidoreductase chain 3 [Acidimicrobiia bacterium]NCX32229.1 NADH-ubiquinone/plastoquinone oxidoreductase chain 3 [Actinomycetota bacterium]NDA53879.1 NADH-ubiquinone/plastoquinone oxidoreductase chain 3 [Actinomycetota bacterium]NDC12234.1 NADH-ubiquinone/plastoquinone oxidoreductase chain 3 [Actinomycetota bacterium]